MKTIPTYVVFGLLESGKTAFIKDTIASDDSYKTRHTLILSGEEGIEDYDTDFLSDFNSEVMYVDTLEEFNSKETHDKILKINPDRLIIELNGMWDINLVEYAAFLEIYQMINLINFETFPVYFQNMRQRFLDQIKQAYIVIFNRVDDLAKLQPYASSLKLSNNNCRYLEMDDKGELQEAFEVELPYDLDQDIVKIENDDYGIFYIDTFDHRKKYVGKVVEINAMVVLSKSLPKGTFIAGRFCMTCCSNDIQLYGHLCYNNAPFKIKDRMWVHIIGELREEHNDEYDEDEIVIYPRSITQTIPPMQNEVLDLTK